LPDSGGSELYRHKEDLGTNLSVQSLKIEIPDNPDNSFSCLLADRFELLPDSLLRPQAQFIPGESFIDDDITHGIGSDRRVEISARQKAHAHHRYKVGVDGIFDDRFHRSLEVICIPHLTLTFPQPDLRGGNAHHRLIGGQFRPQQRIYLCRVCILRMDYDGIFLDHTQISGTHKVYLLEDDHCRSHEPYGQHKLYRHQSAGKII